MRTNPSDSKSSLRLCSVIQVIIAIQNYIVRIIRKLNELVYQCQGECSCWRIQQFQLSFCFPCDTQDIRIKIATLIYHILQSSKGLLILAIHQIIFLHTNAASQKLEKNKLNILSKRAIYLLKRQQYLIPNERTPIKPLVLSLNIYIH